MWFDMLEVCVCVALTKHLSSLWSCETYLDCMSVTWSTVVVNHFITRLPVFSYADVRNLLSHEAWNHWLIQRTFEILFQLNCHPFSSLHESAEKVLATKLNKCNVMLMEIYMEPLQGNSASLPAQHLKFRYFWIRRFFSIATKIRF